jgi:hypothetical protein
MPWKVQNVHQTDLLPQTEEPGHPLAGPALYAHFEMVCDSYHFYLTTILSRGEADPDTDV